MKNRRISLFGRVFIYFLSFSLVVILLLFSLQSVFFDRIYKRTKENQTASALSSAITTLSYDPEGMSETLENISAYYNVCILVTDRDLNTIASAENSTRCVIHSLNYLQLSALYNSAVSHGGNYTEYSVISDSFISPPSGFGKSSAPASLDPDLDNESMIMVSVISSDTGDQYIFFVNSVLNPVGEANSTNKTIIILISAVIFILSIITSLFISRAIARPISCITKEAHKLSNGEFIPELSDSGYCKEIFELSETLKSVGDELSIAEKLRRELLANISHDLRTPLTLISGTAEMMKDFDDERTDQNIDIIINESSRMNRLLQDAMDLSKIQSRSEPIKSVPFNLSSMLSDVHSEYNIEGRDYLITLSSEDNVIVLGEESLIRRVIENLVSNAIHYLGDGNSIELVLLREPDGRHVRVEVRDNGEGISEEDLPHLFDRYYRSKQNHIRSYDGSGLGLSIVKSILDAHGSAFGVSSTPGVGSVFWFDLEISEH